MAFDTTIDVTVSHSLGQAGAFDRVVRWLDSKRGQATPILTTINHRSHTITSVSETRGREITLNIFVTGSTVDLHSAPIEPAWWQEWIADRIIKGQERTLHAELVEALKP